MQVAVTIEIAIFKPQGSVHTERLEITIALADIAKNGYSTHILHRYHKVLSVKMPLNQSLADYIELKHYFVIDLILWKSSKT